MNKKIYTACASALALFVCVPAVSSAQVVINEIAWMGTDVSANDEWIELHNTSTDAVSLEGWHLSADDGTPNISLHGTIEPDGYFLLERSDDMSVPDVPAEVIFTGGIGNDAENLSLLDGSGATIDRVESGASWSLGGDNITKHTAQRQTDGSWITGIPTPRALNSTENTKTTPSSDGEVAGASTTKSTKTSTVVGYRQKVFTYAGSDISIVAGAFGFFEGHAIDSAGEPLGRVRHTWTFGDGASTRVRNAKHIYHVPGMYTAVFTAFTDEQRVRDKVFVEVLEPKVSIMSVVMGEQGYVSIRNDSDKELDMSGWELFVDTDRKVKQHFTMPRDTLVAPQATVAFAEVITNITVEQGEEVSLILPSGKTVATYQ